MKDLRSQPEPTPEYYLTNGDELGATVNAQKNIVNRHLDDIKRVLGEDWVAYIRTRFGEDLEIVVHMRHHGGQEAMHFAVRGNEVEVFIIGHYAQEHNELQRKLNDYLNSSSGISVVKT